MTRITIVTQPTGKAGERQTSQLQALLSEITTTSVVTPSGDSKSMSGYVASQLSITRQLASRDLDVVWFYGSVLYLLPILYARLTGSTVVVQKKGNVPVELFYEWDGGMSAWFAMTVLLCIEFISVSVAHVAVYYTPMMTSRLHRSPFTRTESNALRYVDLNQYKVTKPYSERSGLGFVGRLVRAKNLRELINYANWFQWELTIVGDGPLYDELRELAGPTVTLVGWQPNPEEWYNEFRLLVVNSSDMEGFSSVILEAMACGTPVLSRDVGGVTSVVRHGVNGFIMNDTTDIESVLDREDLHIISKQCRFDAERWFSFEAAVNRYERILRGITQ